MKNKILVKRVLAFALAATMVVGEASTVLASDLSIDGVETDQSLVGAYNGEVSKVIGLEGSSAQNTDYYYLDASGNRKYYYTVSTLNSRLKAQTVAKGDVTTTCKDAATGLAKIGDKYYYCGSNLKSGDTYEFTTSYIMYYCYDGDYTKITDDSYEVKVYKTYDAATAYSSFISEIASYRNSDGSYTIDGVTYDGYLYTYSNDQSKITYVFYKYDYKEVYQVIQADDLATATAKVKTTDSRNNSYYTINNKYYKQGHVESYGSGFRVYSGENYEIAFADSYTSKVTWNQLSSIEANATTDGKKIYVGYEVKCNDVAYGEFYAKDSTGALVGLTTNEYASLSTTFANENYKVEVRGVYYTKTETKNAAGNTVISYDVYKTGEWSTYNYTVADSQTEVSVPSTLTVKDNGTTVDVTFDAVNNAKVRVYQYDFKEALTDASTAEKVIAAYNNNTSESSSDYETADCGETKVSFTKSTSMTYKYHYYVAYLSDVRSYNDYKIKTNADGTTLYSGVAYLEWTGETGVSDLQNFRVEYNQDGGYTIKWDKEDSNKEVYIYRYTDATFPADYNYDAYDASNKTNGITTTYFSTFDNNKQALVCNNSKLTKGTANISDGEYSFSDTYSTEVGRTYYFVAMTVDTYNSNVAKTTPIKLGDVDYYYYNTVGNATAVISAARTLGTPSVEATVTKDSVKLTMSGAPTGYVIYKKNSKGKFKKLTTTTDNNYTDTGLKLNKTYTYRVYEYYYNDVSGNNDVAKKYTTVSATTCKTDKFEVKATMSSTKKVKVSWTKIKNATKYEVYRITTDGDKTVSNSKTAFATTVKLVKTIKKASKTSFTDKVNAGQSYTYRVVATYKSDKKKVKVEDSADITMKLETPEITKVKWSGTTVKFTWDKNKFAEGYQVKYTTYDAAGNADTNQAVEAKTTSNSYSVTVSPYGYVYFYVCAYNGNVYSSYCDYEYEHNYDAAVSGVSATYNAETGAVDVAWNASASATFYRVYVDTKKPTYDETTKTYSYSYNRAIAKEANDDEKSSTVLYEDVKDEYGSITATTASDNSKLGLKKGVKYYYYVVGYNAAGQQVTYESAPASVTYAIAKPAIKSIKNKKSKKAVIKYSAVEAASGKTTYVIYRSTKKNGTYKKVGSTTKTSYTDKKLKKGKTYYYKVVATGKSALNSDFSVTSSAKKVKIKK